MLNSIILRHIKMQPFCLQYRPQHIPFECMLSITTLKDIFYEKTSMYDIVSIPILPYIISFN